MKKPKRSTVKPDIKQKVLDEYDKLTERLEKRFKVKIAYNVDKVTKVR